MSNHHVALRRFAFTGMAILAAIVSVGTPTAEAEPVEELTWLRLNSCTRAERSGGFVDVDGACLRDHPGFGDDVTICASHFCAAQPGVPGARIIHPTDFGPTT